MCNCGTDELALNPLAESRRSHLDEREGDGKVDPSGVNKLFQKLRGEFEEAKIFSDADAALPERFSDRVDILAVLKELPAEERALVGREQIVRSHLRRGDEERIRSRDFIVNAAKGGGPPERS